MILLDLRNEEEDNRSGYDRESGSNPERSTTLRRPGGEGFDDDGEEPSTDEGTELSRGSTARREGVSNARHKKKSTNAKP